MPKIPFHASRKFASFILYVCIIGLLAQIISFTFSSTPLNPTLSGFAVLFGFLTVFLMSFSLRAKNGFSSIFLLSTFTLITAWRLSALANLQIVSYIFLLALVLKIFNYIACARNNLIESKTDPKRVLHIETRYEWQLLFVRMYLGYDLIPHFCEKILGGAAVRADDVQYFASIGLHNPVAWVILAGCIEFGGAFALSCGFLTRLGSVCLAIYLFVATLMGGHFHNGFIWASTGGGWEYPVLWTVLVLIFVFYGAGEFSLDQDLKDRFRIPKFIRFLMGGRCE